MKSLFTALALLLCTCVHAQTTFNTQSETDEDSRYTYSLRTNKIDSKDLVAAFAEAAGVNVNAKFTGDWTTSDDDGIEYSLDTRRNRLSIEYRGDDPTITQRAKEKVRALKERLDIDTEAPEK